MVTFVPFYLCGPWHALFFSLDTSLLTVCAIILTGELTNVCNGFVP